MPDSPISLLTQDEADSIGRTILENTKADTDVHIRQSIKMRTAYGRNEVRTMESEHTLKIYVMMHVDGGRMGGADTTRTDRDGLIAVVRAAEEAAGKGEVDKFFDVLPEPTEAKFTDPAIFLDSTLKAGDSALQGDTIRSAINEVTKSGFVAAGSLTVFTNMMALYKSSGLKGSTRSAYSEFTTTARSRTTKGSGWAWGGGEDFAKVNPADAVRRAIDLCRRSENPVAVEPGRYTVIMEPEAVAQLLDQPHGMPTEFMSASSADMGQYVYAKKEGGNKIGLQMYDSRVTVFTDPHDPDLPYSPLNDDGNLHPRVDWFKKGVLNELTRYPYYAKEKNLPALWHPQGRAHYVIDGATTSLEDMIKSTKRGIWVHHFGGVGPVNSRTLMLSGVSRDGAFLIENGKITKPIKNLRFNESPFFFMNKIDAFGPSVRASQGMVVPRLKVHDFEFTSMSDAI